MTEKQLREFTAPKYLLVDNTDPKHPVNVKIVTGFENAKTARTEYRENRPNTKGSIYRVN